MAKKHGCVILFSRRIDGVWIGIFASLFVFSLFLAAPAIVANSASQSFPKLSKAFRGSLPITELTEEEATLHALNRLGFGPRPGDVERVRKLGLEKWIDQQLHPESIEDSALSNRLARYPTLAMSSAQLLDEYPRPEVAARRAGMTREEYQKQIQERQRQQEERQRRMESGEMDLPAAAGQPAVAGEAGARPRDRLLGDPNMGPARLEDVRAPQRIVAELSMAKLTRAVFSERQLNEVLADFWYNHFNVFAAKGADRWLITSYENNVIRPHALGKFKDLLAATAQSPAMLFYLDNWMSADPKAAERMQRELAARRARFDRLFGGQDPMMAGRIGANGRILRRGRMGLPAGAGQPGGVGQQRMPDASGQGPLLPRPNQPPPQQRRRGLNENYARELMELHTLGVDGGYTQQDVIEVARCFTGWTLRAPQRDPEFQFDERIHDTQPKIVLGQRIDAGGMKDGEAVIELLARHPNTAKFISTKLARRFVSDNPPPALVDAMARTFLSSDGDIRAVLRTLFHAPEFWSRAAYRAKIKKPFELIASAARALDAQLEVPLPLVAWSARIGEPLYQCQPPTGYSDKAENWVNSGTLLNRMNFALALAGNRLRGMRVDLNALAGEEAAADAQKALAKSIDLFLGGQASSETRSTLEKQLTDPQILRATLDDPVQKVDLGVIAGLVLGSPEFQRR